MSFDGAPPMQLELLATRRAVWRVVSGFRYEAEDLSVGVPASWITDLTSIPWWIPFLAREGTHTPASVVHDVVYAKGRVMVGEEEVEVDRLFADQTYLRAMQELGTPPVRCWFIYRGVRLGGWRVWNKYRKKQRLDRAAQARGESAGT